MNEIKKSPIGSLGYENDVEMEIVVGTLDDNSFIIQQKEELRLYKAQIKNLVKILL